MTDEKIAARQWSPPSLATHRADPEFAAVEIVVTRGPSVAVLPPTEFDEDGNPLRPGLPEVTPGPVLRERARCPKCGALVSLHEISLWWCDTANDIAPRCSGCRTATNRAEGGPAKEDILRVLGAPEWHQKWTRVMRKIARHPGRSGGLRAMIGVVD